MEKREIITYLIIIFVGLIVAQHMNVVVSGSMEPAFYRGDIVIVEKSNMFGIHEFNPDNVQVGDIVVYDAAWFSSPVIHRVINITHINGTKYFVIKGDNNKVPDPYYVKSDQINERVLTINNNPVVIPKIGYITILIRGL